MVLGKVLNFSFIRHSNYIVNKTSLKYLSSKATSTFLAAVGDYEFHRYTPPYLEETWNLMKEIYLKEETISQTIGIGNHPTAVEEIKSFFTWALDDDVSIILKNNQGTVAGCSINKIWARDDFKALEDMKNQCNHPKAQQFFQELIDEDIFKFCPVDYIFEIYGGAASNELRGKRIGGHTFYQSVALAKQIVKERKAQLNSGQRIPQIVFAMVTSPVAKAIVKRSGLEHIVPYRKPVYGEGEKQPLDAIVAFSYL